MQEILEYAQFTLKPDVSEDQLHEAAEALSESFLKRQPGYLRRELVEVGIGTYADLIWWRSRDEASAAMEEAMKSPACATYFGIMDLDPENPDEAVKHYTVVASYGA